MLIQFWSHETHVNSAKELYVNFNATYPEESRAFLWSFANFWRFNSNWILIGLLSGTTVLCLMFIVIALFANQRNGKEIVADFLVILVYLSVFLIFSYTFNPLILQRPTSVLNAFATSLICGASSHLLLIHDRLEKKRRTKLPGPNFSNTIEKEFRLKSYELEQVEYRDILNSLMWVFVFLSAGLIFATIVQYSFALPLEITFSNIFAKTIIAIVLVYLLNTIALLVGVFYQLMYEIHDIVNLIREQTVKLEKREQKGTQSERMHK